MSRKVLFVAVIAAVCIVGIFVVRSKAAKNYQDHGLIRLTYTETTREPDGQIKTRASRVRFVEPSTGQYKETYYDLNGQEQEVILLSKQGAFKIIDGVLYPVDEFSPRSPYSFSAEAIKKNAVGTVQILGYTAYIKKSASGTTETWVTPELGSHIPLKLIMYGGINTYTQLEAVSISHEPAPTANFFDPPTDLPVSVSQAKIYLEGARDRNDHRAVERYSRLITKWQPK